LVEPEQPSRSPSHKASFHYSEIQNVQHSLMKTEIFLKMPKLNQSINRPIDNLTNQSINPSIHRPIDNLTNQSINQSLDNSID
jgi:hypothetical protein